MTHDRNTPPPASKTLDELTPEEMRDVIYRLVPKREMHAGIKFLNLLLKRDGVSGIVTFVKKASQILDKEGMLLGYDFDGYEELLKQSQTAVLRNRRNFLLTVGAATSGAIFLTDGVVSLGDNIAANLSPAPTPQSSPQVTRRNLFSRVREVIGGYPAAAAEALIGSVLVYEGIDKLEELKLKQVANAVAELAERMPTPPSEGRAR